MRHSYKSCELKRCPETNYKLDIIIIFIKRVMLEKVYSTFSLCFELLNETITRLGYIINNPQSQRTNCPHTPNTNGNLAI